jgi:hypothetical protein
MNSPDNRAPVKLPPSAICSIGFFVLAMILGASSFVTWLKGRLLDELWRTYMVNAAFFWFFGFVSGLVGTAIGLVSWWIATFRAWRVGTEPQHGAYVLAVALNALGVGLLLVFMLSVG